MTCEAPDKESILLQLYKLLLLTIIITITSVTLIANDNDNDASQTQPSIAPSSSNNSNHLQEKKLFTAIVHENYGDHEAAQEALQARADPNIQFMIYDKKGINTNFTLMRSLRSIQVTDSNTIPIPMPTGIYLDSLFQSHTRRTNMITTTALHIAVVIGNPTMVNLLLKFRAKASAKDANGLTALELLVYQKQIDNMNREWIVRFFIDNHQDNEIIANTYHHAVMQRDVPLAASLVKYGRAFIPESRVNARVTVFDCIPLLIPFLEEEERSKYRWMTEQLTDRGLIESKPSLFERVFER